MLHWLTSRLFEIPQEMAAWRRDQAVAWALPALHLLLLVVFFVLDLRDLYVKALWLGPYMRYGFHATWTSTFAEASLVSSTNLSAFQSGDEVDFLTGWPSFLEKCEAIHASNGFFHSARGINCALGSSSRRVVSSELVFVADMRVDSVAWSACKLLYLNRRPPICQENVVAEFLRRYRLADPILTPESMAEPYSDAEREILRLLELIGRSYPLSDVVCVEGFQHSGPGHYTATIFGCASPNIFEAAFVGLDAASFADLQRELAWLTSDVLNIMGLEFVIRQNSRSGFVTSVDPGDHLLLSHHTDINFSSFGHFYVALIILDIVLLSFHTHGALETASVLLLPLWGTQDAEDINRLTKDYSWTILYRSLYRSPLIVLLTLVSGVLSWQFQLPNSIVWSWNEDSTGKTHALLATMRVWMIVNCVLNQLWSLFAVISEHHAYHVVTRTFISTIEVLVISGCVAILRLSPIFSAGTIKYQLEHQRQWDDKSFLNHEAFANSFNEELDYLLVTTREVLATVYSPLFATILNSLLAITVYLAVKGVCYRVRRNTRSLLGDEEKTEVIYERLPLEEVLCTPVRAQSLVRSTFELEVFAQDQVFLPPAVYFDFGVLLDNDIIRTRRGFLNVIHLKIDVAKYFSPTGPVSAPVTVISPHLMSSQFQILPTPTSSEMRSLLLDTALHATDGVAVSGPEGEKEDGRRPLGETVNSPASRSMRRRKSTNEFPIL